MGYDVRCKEDVEDMVHNVRNRDDIEGGLLGVQC